MKHFLTALVLIYSSAVSSAVSTARPHPELPLPEGVEGQAGLRFIDLNGDGFEDIVFSNDQSYGVHLYNDVEKKNLGWTLGWPHLIRAGKAGDADALPLTTGDDVTFKDGALWVKGKRALGFDELCRPPAPAPRTPQDSLKAIHVKPGFVVELVAHEPLVQDPIFVDWSADGKMWVVEIADYPFHHHNRITRSGRVKVLEDTNGDGTYDKATLFLDDLQYPTGLAFWKSGLYVPSVPSVLFHEDTDGDGRADKHTPVLDGFKVGNPQHLVNGFAWGLDGWLYGGNGDSGGIVSEAQSGEKHDLSGRDFRFHPATGEFELQPGKAQYGRWRDDFGNWFGNNNSNLGWHYFYEDRYLARNPQLAVRTLKQDLNPQGKKLYPVSAPMRRFNQPDSVNLLTSGCSLMPYRDELFGAAYASSVFICEPANNLVHHELLRPDGITFTSQRAKDEAESEFLASEDNWSRFTQARTGPDGCLYVVDFYRLVLEHPEWIPKQLIENLDLFAGSDKGRIFRVRPAAMKPQPMPNLAAMNDAALGDALASPNGWVRDTAQRLMIERASKWSREDLTGSPAAQVQQLWTLHTLGTLQTKTLIAAMQSPLAAVREHSAKVAESYLADKPVLAGLVKLAGDTEARVKVQAVFSLGEAKGADLKKEFSEVAKRDAATPGMLVALLSAASDHSDAANWQAMLRGTQKVTSAAPVPKIVSNTNPDRDKVVRAYSEVAALKGDAAAGHALYTAVCSACHRLKNEGNEIGPDLGTIASKPTEQLIEAILDPNRAVEQRYLTTTFTLKDGKIIVGMIAEETANSITVKLAGTTEIILRSHIAKTETSTRSLMPDGLETLLKPQQMADVLAWIRAK